MTYYGLDVILEVPEPPMPNDWWERHYYLMNGDAPCRNDYDWNLIEINILSKLLWCRGVRISCVSFVSGLSLPT
jgi:hypothetical protein